MDVPHELLERLGVNGECVDLQGNRAVHPELAQSQTTVKKESGSRKTQLSLNCSSLSKSPAGGRLKVR